MDTRRKRILFRVLHSGTQETDPFLARFAESALCGFDSVQLARFEALLDWNSGDRLDRQDDSFNLYGCQRIMNGNDACPRKHMIAECM